MSTNDLFQEQIGENNTMEESTFHLAILAIVTSSFRHN